MRSGKNASPDFEATEQSLDLLTCRLIRVDQSDLNFPGALVRAT